MIQSTCIEKIKNKQGVIIEYKIKDSNGQAIKMKSYVLKDLIHKGALTVNNLTLTSDNRLVSKKVVQKAIKKKDIENMIAKAAQAVAFMEEATLDMGDSYDDLVGDICNTAGIKVDTSGMSDSQLNKLHIQAYRTLFSSKDRVSITFARFAENFYKNNLETLLYNVGYLESRGCRGKLAEHINNLEIFSRLLMNKEIISEETYGLIASMKLDFDDMDKGICELGYKIGHTYFKYLDNRYFLGSNDVYKVGSVQLASDREREFGEYVIHAAYNCSGLPNNVSIIAGFKRDRKDNKRIIIEIQHKIKDYSTQLEKYKHIKTVETNSWNYEDISKAIAVEINSIAKREMTKGV